MYINSKLFFADVPYKQTNENIRQMTKMRKFSVANEFIDTKCDLTVQ